MKERNRVLNMIHRVLDGEGVFMHADFTVGHAHEFIAGGLCDMGDFGREVVGHPQQDIVPSGGG